MDTEFSMIEVIQSTIEKLEYLQHLQHASFRPLDPEGNPAQNDAEFHLEKSGEVFWYLGLVKVRAQDLIQINSDFNKSFFHDDFFDIALTLGQISFSIDQVIDSETLQLQLYKFNQNLTRLFKNKLRQNHTSAEGTLDHSTDAKNNFSSYHDTGLIMTTITSILVSKLSELLHTVQALATTQLISGLVYQIVENIISQRILQPYHNRMLEYTSSILRSAATLNNK